MKKYVYSSSFFLGETINGRPTPVFFDLHTSIVNNESPGCLITGAPGMGKTFLAQTLTTMSAIAGKTTVVIDPKGDFLPLVNLSSQIGKPVIWNLSKGRAGMLDPFYMSKDKSETLSLVIDVIEVFLGGLDGSDIAVLSPIVKDVISGINPSLQKVVDELLSSQKDRAQELGAQLNLIREMRFAKLCFAPGNVKRQPISITQGLTIISTVGLDLPTPGEENMSRNKRLSSGIFFLLTEFIKFIMRDDESQNPKTIVIDEAHSIISAGAGARVIRELARLGRSRYLALLLVTQNQSDIEPLKIENTIATRFAFRSDLDEAKAIVRSMNLPEGEDFEETIVELEQGQVLMKDFKNRYATMEVSAWRQDWKEAFDTNPLERLRKARAEKGKKLKMNKDQSS